MVHSFNPPQRGYDGQFEIQKVQALEDVAPADPYELEGHDKQSDKAVLPVFGLYFP
jgi:hypothetical protein